MRLLWVHSVYAKIGTAVFDCEHCNGTSIQSGLHNVNGQHELLQRHLLAASHAVSITSI